MLSQKSKYALKALLVLSQEYGKGPVLISEIAGREKIPHRFLELILLELKNHGVLLSRKGKGGGYFLSKPPDHISVGQVLRMLEGPLAPLPCASLMKEVRDATAAILDSTTLEDVLKRAQAAATIRESLSFSI
jgi:Rrf2 family protein